MYPEPSETVHPLTQDSPSVSAPTIAAIATATVPEQGSIGIVRMSGPDAFSIAEQLFHAPGQQPWESHRILYGFIQNPDTASTVDEALLLLMRSPRSFTREDVVEFHCHGGIIAVQQVLKLCLSLGANLAQPGEFTLRAFLNGRLDLTQAESVADLVGARSPQAAQAAVAGLQGKLATPIHALRQQCLEMLAEIEARIDFADDLPPLDEPDMARRINVMGSEMEVILATAEQGELLRSGLKVAIVGRPNVGKSSLLNAWSQSDRAIVTELPGTTRDVVESNLVVGGIPVQVLDTAGIRDAQDQVEQIGIERSLRTAESADIVLFTVDMFSGWGAEEQRLLDAIHHPDRASSRILVLNKFDLVQSGPEEPSPMHSYNAPSLPENLFTKVVKTSALKRAGIQDLENAILETVTSGQVKASNLELAINQRQAQSLNGALTHLRNVENAVQQSLPLDFWTIDLRGAAQKLGEITGEDVVESVLDRIFAKFCIGK
ncbi:MAG: tRNA uridine-5-carboxymethylaminomethyl(34) synthesis GTPase MnmE [Cyanobacteria bacterium P01_F01_bin.42]